MIVTLVIVLYIINVVASRELNNRLYKLNNMWSPSPWLWFTPGVGFFTLLGLYFQERFHEINFKSKSMKWFVGQNWKTDE